MLKHIRLIMNFPFLCIKVNLFSCYSQAYNVDTIIARCLGQIKIFFLITCLKEFRRFQGVKVLSFDLKVPKFPKSDTENNDILNSPLPTNHNKSIPTPQLFLDMSPETIIFFSWLQRFVWRGNWFFFAVSYANILLLFLRASSNCFS